MELSIKLKELREQKKITQTELSNQVNMPLISYTRYENGITEPTIKNLIKLADYYNVSLDYLVDRKYGNELGFLTEFQYNTIKCYLLLNEQNQAIINGRIMSLLEIQ